MNIKFNGIKGDCMSREIKLILLTVVVVICCSCGTSKYNETTELGDSFLSLIKMDRYEEALLLSKPDYPDKEKINSIQKNWVDFFINIKEQFGDLNSYELIGWEIEYLMKQKDQEDGIYYNLSYELAYTKNAASVELLIYKSFFNNELKIHNFHIEPKSNHSDSE